MLFAVACIPIFAVAFFAVNLDRSQSARVTIQSAIDAASLAGARMLEDSTRTDSDVAAIARAYFAAGVANVHGDVACPQPTVVINRAEASVRVSADCDLPVLLPLVMKREAMLVGAAAGARANLTKLDLAMMLDVSGSMSGQKLEDLKDAAQAAVNTLITPGTGERVRIGYVTYSTAVNAGSYAAAVRGPSYDPSTEPTCVSERDGWAAFRDDEPAVDAWIGGLATGCPTSTLMPLTSKVTDLTTAIEALTAGGYTAGHLGVAWSWYLIAPDWDDIWPTTARPLAYSEPDTIKAVILMTDGKFNTEYSTPEGKDTKAQAKELCKKMRAKGVRVFAVAFEAPESSKTLLKACAYEADQYFEAENGDELKAAYAEIAAKLNRLRVAE